MLLTLFAFIILVFSVVIHEVSHGIAALWQGDPTAKLSGRLTLNPIPHIDPLGSIIIPIICALLPGGMMLGWAKPVPFNPYNLRNRKWGEAIVAFAGPLSNIIIAILLGLFIRFYGLAINSQLLELLAIAVLTNIVLAVFNLVPLPPLDGSKILYSLFPEKMGRFLKLNERYGIILTLIFIIAFVQLLDPVVRVFFNLVVGGQFLI